MGNYIDDNKVQNSELIKELDALNMSTNVTYIVAISVFLTYLFLRSEKTRVKDEINGVPDSENRAKLNYLPLLSNELIILTLLIAIKNNLESLNTFLSIEDSEQNRKDINLAKETLLASILGFTAAIIVYKTLSNAPNIIISPLSPFPI